MVCVSAKAVKKFEGLVSRLKEDEGTDAFLSLV